MRELLASIFPNLNLGTPTAVYCEKATDGFIARPGYAISNIPYILLGIFLILTSKGRKLSIAFGLTSIMIGSFSFLYDASFTFVSQYLDWQGMFTFMALLIVLNLRRLFGLSIQQSIIAYAILLGSHIFLTLAFREISILGFAAGVIFVVFSEVYLYLNRTKLKQNYNYRYFLIGFTLFFIGWLIWQLDAHQILCDPSNLFNGRGIFHYMTTITIYFLHKFHLKSVT